MGMERSAAGRSVAGGINTGHRLLQRSRANLRAARLLHEAGFDAIAMSRAYYAMLHGAEALLWLDSDRCATHEGAIARFEERWCVGNDHLPVACGPWLRQSYQARLRADYDLDAAIDPAATAAGIELAGQFLDAVVASWQRFTRPARL